MAGASFGLVPSVGAASFAGASVAAPAASASAVAPAAAPLTHVVVAGDTLSAIARDAGLTLAALVARNPQVVDPDRIFPGDVIVLGEAGGAPAPPASPADPGSPAIVHVVVAGDTLAHIARTYGLALSELLEQNPQIVDPDLILPGQPILIVPAVQPPAPGPTPEPTRSESDAAPEDDTPAPSNGAPVAVADDLGVFEVGHVIDLAPALANDLDVDGDALAITDLDLPEGLVAIEGEGVQVISLETGNYELRYRATDGSDVSAPAPIRLSVTRPVDDQPREVAITGRFTSVKVSPASGTAGTTFLVEGDYTLLSDGSPLTVRGYVIGPFGVVVFVEETTAVAVAGAYTAGGLVDSTGFAPSTYKVVFQVLQFDRVVAQGTGAITVVP